MRFTTIFILGFFILRFSFAQNEVPIKTEQVGKYNWNYYQESDSVILIKVFDKKDKLKHIKRFSDMSLITEVGEWGDYSGNQKLSNRVFFDNGFPIGIWSQLNSSGNAIREWNYDFKLNYVGDSSNLNVRDSFPDNLSLDTIITVDKMPQFKGGDINDFRMDLAKRIYITTYMVEKYEGSGIHRLKVQFAINKEGKVVDVKAHNQGKKTLEKDAVRLVRESPNWTPGIKDNKPVKVQFTFPVVYVFP